MLASFEKSEDFLFTSAFQGRLDKLQGVSERIIVVGFLGLFEGLGHAAGNWNFRRHL
jgi:hypothetical protein